VADCILQQWGCGGGLVVRAQGLEGVGKVSTKKAPSDLVRRGGKGVLWKKLVSSLFLKNPSKGSNLPLYSLFQVSRGRGKSEHEKSPFGFGPKRR